MKKIRKIVVLAFVSSILFFNYLTLFAEDPIIEIPWNPDFPAIGDLQTCQQNLEYGWTRGSVEWVCTVQWVCPECRCTPEACGQVSIGHKY